MKRIKFNSPIKTPNKSYRMEIHAIWLGSLGNEARFSISAMHSEAARWVTMCQLEFQSAQAAHDAIYETGFDLSDELLAHDLANVAVSEGHAVKLL
jgi:hypothetical protein